MLFIKSIFSFFICLFSVGCGTGQNQIHFSKADIQNVIDTRPFPGPMLTPGTYRGCEMVPWAGQKPQIEGTEFTGRSCSVTVEPDNAVTVSFVEKKISPLTLWEANSDTFIAGLNEDQVLLVQFRHNKEVISVTQTGYDSQGNLNYGQSGKGDFIKSCIMTFSEPCEY